MTHLKRGSATLPQGNRVKTETPDVRTEPKVSFVSLGCAKNLVDSEVLLGQLVQNNFLICEDQKDADIVVINTCSFLQAAEEESTRVIQEAVKLKHKGLIRAVVVAGCMPQRHGAALIERLPGVDAILGVSNRQNIIEVCRSLVGDRSPSSAKSQPQLFTADIPKYEVDRDRLRLTPRHTAYIRLSEGCNHTCAFCIIPQIKGAFRSKPMEVILDEARELVRDGAVELNLIAQDTTSYGLDLYRKLVLSDLLDRLAEIDGLRWIRLLYCYPTYVNDALIRTIASNPKVVKYMDMPVQHTRERMLRLMRRGITEDRQKELIETLRRDIPDLVLRTTIIVGFPGETDEDFQGMMNDLKEIHFDRLGTFRYSSEPGTKAHEMEGHVAEETKEQRYNAAMELQQSLVMRKHQSWMGRTMETLIERRDAGKNWIGRTYGDAPDVDGTVLVTAPRAHPGEIMPVRITGYKGYDLIAEPVNVTVRQP